MRANPAWTHLLDGSHMVAGKPVWYQCELITQEHIYDEAAGTLRPLAAQLI